MLASVLVCLAFSAAARPGMTDLADWLRRVEETRYEFETNRDLPFAEAYPRAVFQKQALLTEKKECVLRSQYGETVGEAALRDEADRIERDTGAPEVWRAVKTALGNDPALIESVVCRPLVVDRRLRHLFAYDRAIHATALAEITSRRIRLLRGGDQPTGPNAFMNVLICGTPLHSDLSTEDSQDCKGIGGVLASQMLASVESKDGITPVLEDTEFFYVARLHGPERRVADGFVAKKRDYMEWLEATLCDSR